MCSKTLLFLSVRFAGTGDVHWAFFDLVILQNRNYTQETQHTILPPIPGFHRSVALLM